MASSPAANMVRTQIYLSREEDAALERESNATGRSKSQLIRDAIDRIYFDTDRAELIVALEQSAGAWRRRQNGAAWVERQRSGRLSRLHENNARDASDRERHR